MSRFHWDFGKAKEENVKKIKNLFIWLAWHERNRSDRSMLIIYGIIIALMVVIFFPSWLISGNVPESVGIAFASSAGLMILLVFIASIFFSSSEKNWRIAIEEGEKLILDYPELTEDQYGAEYLYRLKLFIDQLNSAEKKDSGKLNKFVKTYRDFFKARKAAVRLYYLQNEIFAHIHEAKQKIKSL